jgi:hypothetical protein
MLLKVVHVLPFRPDKSSAYQLWRSDRARLPTCCHLHCDCGVRGDLAREIGCPDVPDTLAEEVCCYVGIAVLGGSLLLVLGMGVVPGCTNCAG